MGPGWTLARRLLAGEAQQKRRHRRSWPTSRLGWLGFDAGDQPAPSPVFGLSVFLSYHVFGDTQERRKRLPICGSWAQKKRAACAGQAALTVASPHHAKPYPAKPRIALPGLARPRRAPSCIDLFSLFKNLALPSPASPRPASPGLAECDLLFVPKSPCHAAPDPAIFAFIETLPSHAAPRQAVPRHAAPRQAVPSHATICHLVHTAASSQSSNSCNFRSRSKSFPSSLSRRLLSIKSISWFA